MREKDNYRDMLFFLGSEKKLPLLMNKGEATEALGVSRTKLEELIATGRIVVDKNKIPIGSIARYLCG